MGTKSNATACNIGETQMGENTSIFKSIRLSLQEETCYED